MKDQNPPKQWAVASVACALVCIVGTICFIAFAILRRADWQSWGGLALIALIVYMMLAVLAIGILGTLSSIIGVVRHESRAAVITGLSLNLSVLLCLGAFFFVAFVKPSMRMKRDREQRHAHYLVTRTPQQHLFDVACRRGGLAEMQKLLRDGIDPNSRHQSGIPVIIAAVGGANVEASCLLLRSGADPELQDAQGWTALHHACTAGADECVSELLHHGADVHALTSKGEKAIDLVLVEDMRGFSCGREHVKLLLGIASGLSKQELKKLRDETPCRQHNHAWVREEGTGEAFQHWFVPD